MICVFFNFWGKQRNIMDDGVYFLFFRGDGEVEK